MDNEHIVEDARRLGLLIEVCAGCGLPYRKHDADLIGVKFIDCDCPAGTNLRWNKVALDAIKNISCEVI